MARKKNANLFTNRSCLGNDLNFHGNDCLHNLKYQPIVRSSTQKQPFRSSPAFVKYQIYAYCSHPRNTGQATITWLNFNTVHSKYNIRQLDDSTSKTPYSASDPHQKTASNQLLVLRLPISRSYNETVKNNSYGVKQSGLSINAYLY